MPEILIHKGDNRLVLKDYPDAHFSSCVCDPPYELGFMGKSWDKTGIAYDVAMWKEVYRVLKPGAHLLAFGGSRTYHRLACAIEDAGFQVRDQIMWLYGSGFPKSLDVSKGIDKAAGAEREVVGPDRYAGRRIEGSGPVNGDACYGQYGIPKGTSVPATDLARQWDGWGTALKPAHEPIVVARKPLEGTVVANVLKHGTGAINVAGCRIEHKTINGGNLADNPHLRGTKERAAPVSSPFGRSGDVTDLTSQDGRWPSNIIHDGSPEVLACFPDSKGQQGDVRGTEQSRTGGEGTVCYGEYGRVPAGKRGDNGSAARFFYAAKASQAERGKGCNHPTVKPLALMCYLVRLVTPPGGVVLDPFMGSGSTLIAAAKEGFNAVGIELEAENCEIAERRCHGHLGVLAEVKHG